LIAIEKNPANDFSYGKANLDKTGCIMLNGEKINNLNMLVQQCLAHQQEDSHDKSNCAKQRTLDYEKDTIISRSGNQNP